MPAFSFLTNTLGWDLVLFSLFCLFCDNSPQTHSHPRRSVRASSECTQRWGVNKTGIHICSQTTTGTDCTQSLHWHTDKAGARTFSANTHTLPWQMAPATVPRQNPGARFLLSGYQHAGNRVSEWGSGWLSDRSSSLISSSMDWTLEEEKTSQHWRTQMNTHTNTHTPQYAVRPESAALLWSR